MSEPINIEIKDSISPEVSNKIEQIAASSVKAETALNKLRSSIEGITSSALSKLERLTNSTALAQMRLEMAQNKLNKSHADSESALQRATAATARAEMATVKLQQAKEKSTASVHKHGSSWLEMAKAMVVGMATMQLINGTINVIIGTITGGIKAVDEFQMSVIQMSAVLTSLAENQLDIAGTYKQAKEYAEGLQAVLQRIDANTSLNLQNLQTMTLEMAKQGVTLDDTNAKQVESFTRIANAVALYSRNGADERQVRQEIAALMKGEVRQGDELAKLLNRMTNGELPNLLIEWKKQGTVIDEIGKRLSGFGPAAKDINSTWSAVTSSMKTSLNIIARAGFTDIVKDLSTYVGKANEYLKEHAGMIGGTVMQGWLATKGIVEYLYNTLSAYSKPLTLIGELVGMAFKGLGLIAYSILPAMSERTGAFVASLVDALATLGNIAAIGANAVIGNWAGAAASWEDAKASFKSGGVNTAKAFASGYLDEIAIRANEFLSYDYLKNGNKGGKAPILSSPGEDEEKLKALQKTKELELAYLKSVDVRVLTQIKEASAQQQAELELRHKQGLESDKSALDKKFELQQEASKAELKQIEERFNNVEQKKKEAEAALSASSANKELQNNAYKAEKEYQEVLKETNYIKAQAALAEIKYKSEVYDLTQKESKALFDIQEATANLYSEYLSIMGVRKEELALINLKVSSEKKIFDLEREINLNASDPKKLAALQNQLDMQQRLNETKKQQLETELQIALQNDSFSLQQQQIELMKKKGFEEEAFNKQKTLDLSKLDFEYVNKMIEYQKQLNAVTELGLRTEASLIQQNADLYYQMYQQNRQDVQGGSFAGGSASSGSSWGWDANGNIINPSSPMGATTGSYTITTPNNGAQWREKADAQQQASVQAATAARQAWSETQKAAVELSKDLSLRLLEVQGKTDEASILKLAIEQQEELNDAQQKGLNVTQLLIVQQLEYNKVIKEITIKNLEETLNKQTKLFDEAKAALSKGLGDVANVIKSTIDSLTKTIDGLKGAALSLKETSNRLLIGSNTTLSPEALYAKANSDYTTALQATQNGTVESRLKALQSFGGAAEGLVTASRSYNASTGAFGADFNKVQTDLLNASAMADSLAATLQTPTDIMKEQLTALQAIQKAVDGTAPGVAANVGNTTGAISTNLIGAVGMVNSALGVTNAGLTSVNTGITYTNSNLTEATANALNVANNLGSSASNANTVVGAVGNVNASLSATGLFQLMNTYQANFEAKQATANALANTIASQTAPIGTVASNSASLPTINAYTSGTQQNTAAINGKTGLLKSAHTVDTGFTPNTATIDPNDGFYISNTSYTYYKDGGYTKPGKKIVGELGPELVDYDEPSRVYTTNQLSAALNGGGSEKVEKLLAAALVELSGMRQELSVIKSKARLSAVG